MKKEILFPLLSLILLGILFGCYLSQKKGVEVWKEKVNGLEDKIFEAQPRLKDIKFVEKRALIGKKEILSPAKQRSRFLRHLTQQSENCLVEISSLVVEPVKKEESSSQLSLKIEFFSSYFNLGKYLDRVKTSTSLFTINSLDLKSNNSLDLKGSLTADVYLLPYQVKFSKRQKRSLKWKRDPFLPPEKKVKTILRLPELILTGILWSEGNASAIINSQILRPGDRIEGVEIKAINKKEVILKGPEGEYSLKVHPKLEKR